MGMQTPLYLSSDVSPEGNSGNSNFSVLNNLFSKITELITFPPARPKGLPFPTPSSPLVTSAPHQAFYGSLLEADILKYPLLEGTSHRGHIMPFVYSKIKMNLPVKS